MNWKEDCGKRSTSNASARTRFTRSKRTTRWQLKAPTTIGREERHSTTAALVAKAVREGWSYRVRPAPVCDPRLRAGDWDPADGEGFHLVLRRRKQGQAE